MGQKEAEPILGQVLLHGLVVIVIDHPALATEAHHNREVGIEELVSVECEQVLDVCHMNWAKMLTFGSSRY